MQFTVDTRNTTAFELNALAEFVQKLASVAPGSASDVAGGESQALAMLENMRKHGTIDTPANSGPDRHINVEVHLPEGYGAVVTEGNAASGAPDLPPAAGPAPEVPPAPGNTPPAVAAAPESTSLTAAPAAPTEVPAVPVSTVPAVPVDTPADLDSAGCPWDARIHTSNKATIGDGTWRKKPGVDPALFESVKAELMGKPTASTATETATSTPIPTSAPASAVPEVPSAPAATEAASTSTSSETGAGTAPALPASSAPALLTGNDVMARAMEIQMADGTKSAALFQAIQGAGIPAGPMGLPGCTDQAVLAAALAAVNAVGAQ